MTVRRTEDGGDFAAIVPKGCVPALVLDDGLILTENVAILCWIAGRAPGLAPDGEMGRIRHVEMLSFIATKFHKPFIRQLVPACDAGRDAARRMVSERLAQLAERFWGDCPFGDRFGVADAYLHVTPRWAEALAVDVPHPLPGFMRRMNARAAVRHALRSEGLLGQPAGAEGELECSLP